MESFLFFILPILLLIVASGFFAAAETAITGVSQATIHKLKLEGNQKAIMVSKLRQDKERLISALLLGNSTCNTCVAFLSSSLAEHLVFTKTGIFLTGVLIAIVIFVFAEVLPKTYAFENAEKFSLSVAPILCKLIKILFPITASVQLVVNYILSRFKGGKPDGQFISAAEELRGAIELHHHEGAVVKTDRDMLGSILDLRSTEVGQVMIHRSKMVSLNADTPNAEILASALECGHTRIPLWQGDPDNIIGVLNIKDLMKAAHLGEGNVDAIDITQLVTPPWFVPEHTVISEQLHEFRNRRNHLAIVIDEYGALLGIVTLEDVLEVIVGQIDDEHDKVKLGIVSCPDGSYIIEGSAMIRDINRQLDWNLPTAECSTLAGLLMHKTASIPEEGESFIIYDKRFTVTAKHHNQIKKVIARHLD